jgi:hypothetical protein
MRARDVDDAPPGGAGHGQGAARGYLLFAINGGCSAFSAPTGYGRPPTANSTGTGTGTVDALASWGGQFLYVQTGASAYGSGGDHF